VTWARGHLPRAERRSIPGIPGNRGLRDRLIDDFFDGLERIRGKTTRSSSSAAPTRGSRDHRAILAEVFVVDHVHLPDEGSGGTEPREVERPRTLGLVPATPATSTPTIGTRSSTSSRSRSSPGAPRRPLRGGPHHLEHHRRTPTSCAWSKEIGEIDTPGWSTERHKRFTVR